MAQITVGIRSFLSQPVVYTTFQSLMGARKGWKNFVKEFIRPKEGMNVLDIGCGPADLLEYLPVVNYWGFDISQSYIDHAVKKFGSRGHFSCKILTAEELTSLPKFDVVVASGVLHHMSDDVAKSFLNIAFSALNPGGRLVTVDPCWESGQHPIARFLIANDRGLNVRTRFGYDQLAASFCAKRSVSVRHKKWIPYTHCFMECVRE